MGSRVKIKVLLPSGSAVGKDDDGGSGCGVKVAAATKTVMVEEKKWKRKKESCSANNNMMLSYRSDYLNKSGRQCHLVRNSFQCCRFSNLGLISKLPLMLLILVLVTITSPVNGELITNADRLRIHCGENERS